MSQKELEICNVFSEEDKKFNRKMVEVATEFPKKTLDPFEEKSEYDISSEIIEAFRAKWGISEKGSN